MSMSPRAPSELRTKKQVALYYPYFSVRDETWVKETLLLWEQIATIVPQGVDVSAEDDELTHKLRDNSALVHWSIDSRVRHEALDLALDLLDEGAAASFPNRGKLPVHYGKVSHRFAEELTARGHAMNFQGEWIELDENVGLLFLSVLAHELAASTTAPPISDQTEVAEAYLSLASANSSTEIRYDLLHKNVRLAIPDLASVELDKWLWFRKKYAPLLSEYRGQVSAHSRRIARAQSEDEVQDLLSEWEQEAEIYLDRNRGTFRRFLTPEIAFTGLEFLAAVGALAGGQLAFAGAAAAGAAGHLGLALTRAGTPEQHYLSFLARAQRKFG